MTFSIDTLLMTHHVLIVCVCVFAVPQCQGVHTTVCLSDWCLHGCSVLQYVQLFHAKLTQRNSVVSAKLHSVEGKGTCATDITFLNHSGLALMLH